VDSGDFAGSLDRTRESCKAQKTVQRQLHPPREVDAARFPPPVFFSAWFCFRLPRSHASRGIPCAAGHMRGYNARTRAALPGGPRSRLDL